VKRRRFLRVGLVGAGLLALGGGGLALYPTRETVTPTRPLRVLRPRSFQVLAAIARRVVTAPDADPGAIAHGADDALTSVPAEAQGDFNDLLGLFETALGGLVLDGRVRPFTRLSPEEQDRALESWRDSRLALRRTGYQALRKLCLAAHYARPESWASAHFPPPTPVGEPYDDSLMGTPAWNEARGLEGPP
jgi:hypothetical protein